MELTLSFAGSGIALLRDVGDIDQRHAEQHHDRGDQDDERGDHSGSRREQRAHRIAQYRADQTAKALEREGLLIRGAERGKICIAIVEVCFTEQIDQCAHHHDNDGGQGDLGALMRHLLFLGGHDAEVDEHQRH